MDCWSILEIEPTADGKIIKRAYARLLKVYHPESDPSGFQRLRQAYEQALRQSKWLLEPRDAETIEPDDEVIEESASRVYDQENVAAELLSTIIDNPIEAFMKQVQRLFEDDKLRCEVKEWEALLQDEAYWQLEIRQTLNYRILQYLQERYTVPYYHLPNNVWQVLDNYFFWSQQSRELYTAFSDDFIDYIMKRIGQSSGARNKGERLSEYPDQLLPVLLLVVLVAAAMKIVSQPLPGQHLFWALAMFIGGLFWGGAINFRLAKWLEGNGVFEWAAPYCSYCNRRCNRQVPVLWYFRNRQECSECGKNILPHALTTEVGMGLVFGFSMCVVPNMWMMLKVITVFTIMLFIALTEYTTQVIPGCALIVLAGIGGGANLFLGEPSLQEMAIGAAIGGTIFFLIARLVKGWMNADFTKLVAAMGIVLGWKLLLGALALWFIGLVLIGLAVIQFKQWLTAGKQILCSGRFYIWIGILLLMGTKGVLIFLLWLVVGGLFTMGKAGLKHRFQVLPSAAVLMAATYVVLVYKERILALFH